MRKLRWQLIFSHLLPLLLVTPLVGMALVYVVETQILLADLAQQLGQRANLVARLIQERIEVLADPEQAQVFVAEITVSLTGQVFLLKPDGDLLAASDVHAWAGPVEQPRLDEVLRGHPSVVVTYGLLDQQVEVLVPIMDAEQQVAGYVGVIQQLEGAASLFGRLRRWILLVLLLALALGGLIGLLLARRLEPPIATAANAVVDIAHGREVGLLKPAGPTEIRQLSSSVNVLSERLRQLEEIRRRSLANIVHELGRPLGAIRAAVHVLRQGAGDDPVVREELLGGVENQIERMQPLLDDLAQLQGQVSGQVVLNRHPLSPSDWLVSVLLPWRAAALEKGLDWSAQVPGGLPILDLDPDRMAQVVGNLLSNAIKYTPAGGMVAVEAGASSNEVWISVRDSGPGIDPAEQGQVFEAFYRSQRDQRFPQGLGLGLTIARDLVEAHGGRLELASTPGEGSQFVIRLLRGEQLP